MAKYDLITTIGVDASGLNEATAGAIQNLGEMQRELRALGRVSFADKTLEEMQMVTQRMGDLRENISNTRELQISMGEDFGQLAAKGLSSFTSLAQIAVSTASAFGLSEEATQKVRTATLSLMSATQALGTIQSNFGKGTFIAIGLRIKETAATTANTVAEISSNAAKRAAAAAEALKSGTVVGGTIATKAATAATWLWNTALAANPVVLITAGIAALTTGIWALTKAFKSNETEVEANLKRLREYRDIATGAKAASDLLTASIISGVNKGFTDSLVILSTYSNVIESSNRSLEEKKEALKKIIELNPKILSGLTLENFSTEEGTNLMKEYTATQTRLLAGSTAMNEAKKKSEELDAAKLKRDAALQKSEEIFTDLKKRELEILEREQKLGNKVRVPRNQAGQAIDPTFRNLEEQGLEASKAFQDAEKSIASVTEEYNDLIKIAGNFVSLVKPIEEEITAYEALGASIDKLVKRRQAMMMQNKNVDDISAQINALREQKKYIDDIDTAFEQLKFRDEGGFFDTKKLADGMKDLEKEINDLIYDIKIDPVVIKFEVPNDTSLTTKMAQLADLSGAMASFYDQDTEAYKAWAIIQATISTYVAAAAVMANAAKLGPIAMGIAMAAAIATGLANVAKIAAFETGGIVGGSSFSGDKVPVRVNSGEMILSKVQQSNMFDMINSGGGWASGGGGQVEFHISGDNLVGVLNRRNKKVNSYA